MSKIQILGLNHRQRALADVLWMMNGREDVDRFIQALHPSMRAEAETVVELMMLAVWDEIDTVDKEVKEMLDKFRI
jgi:hypothetical protein